MTSQSGACFIHIFVHHQNEDGVFKPKHEYWDYHNIRNLKPKEPIYYVNMY